VRVASSQFTSEAYQKEMSYYKKTYDFIRNIGGYELVDGGIYPIATGRNKYTILVEKLNPEFLDWSKILNYHFIHAVAFPAP
jgi:hypothetical protein